MSSRNVRRSASRLHRSLLALYRMAKAEAASARGAASLLEHRRAEAIEHLDRLACGDRLHAGSLRSASRISVQAQHSSKSCEARIEEAVDALSGLRLVERLVEESRAAQTKDENVAVLEALEDLRARTVSLAQVRAIRNK